MNQAISIKERLEHVRGKISSHCKSVGRDPSSVNLLAVSKRKSEDLVKEALQEGQNAFGENYVQELVAKAENLTGLDLHWHYIGHLQRNKVKSLLPFVSLLHTLDRVQLAEELQTQLLMLGRTLDCLIQVKLSDEDSKSGCAPQDLPELVKTVAECSQLNLKGLMMIGTRGASEDATRSEMQRLRALKDQINTERLYPTPLMDLSMGMSGDYKIAIEEGSTWIRIGTEIFGPRD